MNNEPIALQLADALLRNNRQSINIEAAAELRMQNNALINADDTRNRLIRRVAELEARIAELEAQLAAVAAPKKWAPEEVADGGRGIRWVTNEGVHGRPTDHDVREYLERTPTANGCHCDDCKRFYAAASDVTAAPAKAGEYPPLVCDYCGALTPDPWHSSGMMNGKMSKHIHSCDSCAARGAAQAAPVDAERLDYLQECGVTVEVLPGRPGWTFRIGGLHGTVHRSVRTAIDAARAAQGGA